MFVVLRDKKVWQLAKSKTIEIDLLLPQYNPIQTDKEGWKLYSDFFFIFLNIIGLILSLNN